MTTPDLLIMRALLFNVALGVLLWAGWHSGLVPQTLALDQTYISEAAIAVFVWAWGLCLYRIAECSAALNYHARGRLWGRFSFTEPDFARRTGPIEVAGQALVSLGILGTMWGFLLALDIDITQLDLDAITPEIGRVIAGMHVALVTSIVGLITSLALRLQLRLLEGGYERLRR